MARLSSSATSEEKRQLSEMAAKAAEYFMPPPLNPLEQAIVDNDAANVKALLEKEKKPLGTNQFALTPMHLAAQRGALGAARELLAVDSQCVHKKGGRGETPLLLAAQMGEGEMISLLLGAGATQDEPDMNGTFPVHMAAMDACSRGDSAVRALLSQDGCDPRSIACKVDPAGSTPVALACSSPSGMGAALEALLDAGADPSAPITRGPGDNHRLRPLHATAGTSPAMVRILLARGASPAGKDGSGRVPLHLAAFGGQVDCLNPLLEAPGGSEVIDAQNNLGATPLILAAQQGKVDCVERLLAAGANACLTDVSGNTAASIARKHGHGELGDAIERAQPEGMSAAPVDGEQRVSTVIMTGVGTLVQGEDGTTLISDAAPTLIRPPPSCTRMI
jgi:ankyrin repeat protein